MVGGGLGALSGHLRHSTENAIADKGDPETDELKRKVQGYQKMTRELQVARAAGLTS